MFCYFGFGSNMNLASLKAKGVDPLASQRAELPGWRLRFNVQHFFRHEGGVGNIEYTGDPNDRVLGVVHQCPKRTLPDLDAAEAYGYGYDRIEVDVTLLDAIPHSVPLSATNDRIRVTTYVGMPSFINHQCLPSQRYLNIVVHGARQAGLEIDYVNTLALHPVHQPEDYPEFQPPDGDFPGFNASSLANAPLYTSLFGSVFDLSEARPQHEFLKGFFGGKDMTLFHLKRMDTSDHTECLDDIRQGRLNNAQRRYLNAFLNEYAREYRYIGHFSYHDY